MRILIVTDAWHPQVNGVVRTLERTVDELTRTGCAVRVLAPDTTRWCTVAAPTYPSIKLELFAAGRVRRVIRDFKPEAVHIATEGPLGLAARRICVREGHSFTTAYHTRFPAYLATRVPRTLARLTQALALRALRWFHAPAKAVLVATASLETELAGQGFRNLARWSRGVDTTLFTPDYGKKLAAYAGLERPILLYVGRVSVEKNLAAFLAARTPGTKVVIGDGPSRATLQTAYPAARFLGELSAETLARHYAAADLFVFPSRSDTFGLVLLEACASGLRVASVPAPGPADIFADPAAEAFSALDEDLERAIQRALALPADSAAPRHYAERFSWQACTEVFLRYLQ